MALEMAKAYPPDVVLLDLGLPGMDGFEVAKTLCMLVPQRGSLYIAAITGYGKPEDKKRAAEGAWTRT